MASDRDNQFAIDLKRTEEFFKHFKPELVQPALDIAQEVGEGRFVRDEIYRVFHTSYKMYRFSVHVYTMVAAMLAPLGFAPADKDEDQNLHDLIKALEYWRFDEVFITFVRDALFTKFNAARGTDNWQGDALKLVGGFFMAKEVCIGSLTAMRQMTVGEGFVFHPGGLSFDDALFLETWQPLGMTFRYGGYKDESKAVQAYARESLKAAGTQ